MLHPMGDDELVDKAIEAISSGVTNHRTFSKHNTGASQRRIYLV